MNSPLQQYTLIKDLQALTSVKRGWRSDVETKMWSLGIVSTLYCLSLFPYGKPHPTPKTITTNLYHLTCILHVNLTYLSKFNVFSKFWFFGCFNYIGKYYNRILTIKILCEICKILVMTWMLCCWGVLEKSNINLFAK